MAIVNEFIHLFKWDLMEEEKEKLGDSVELLTACFQSESLWMSL